MGSRIIKTLKIFLVVVGLVVSNSSAAFDGNRQGFILGLGAGLHTIDIDFKLGGSTAQSDSESGIATSFKIGGGITNQFALYYVRNSSWYSAPGNNGFTVSDMIFTVGISGVGATYYFSPSAPSGYILGAIGLGDISAPFENNVSTDTGDAYMLGGGYEASKGLHFEVTYLVTDLDSSDLNSLTLETSSIQLTVNYLWY